MNDYLELHALYHHGIKGQKWGVRRFQNEDGTLTDEGKDRYLLSRSEQKVLAKNTERELKELVKEKNINSIQARLHGESTLGLKARYERLEKKGKYEKAGEVKAKYEKQKRVTDMYKYLTLQKRKEIEKKVEKMSKDVNLVYRTYRQEDHLRPLSPYSWASTGYKVRAKDSMAGRSKRYNDAKRKIDRGETFVITTYVPIFI